TAQRSTATSCGFPAVQRAPMYSGEPFCSGTALVMQAAELPKVFVFSGTELSPPQARRQLHRLDDLRISGAAAQIARKIMADFLLIGVWILRQQLLGHQNKTGCAKAALKGAAVDERLLHRRQHAAGIQVFNRGDGLSIRSNCEIEATRHRYAIDQNRATT